MIKIVLATDNAGKIKEILPMLKKYSICAVPQGDLGVPTIPETETSFIGNALLKARHASKFTGLPALADDAGLIVHALNGAPGVRSARYAGDNATTKENLEKLMGEMKGKPERSAIFYCSMVYFRYPEDERPLISHGTWEGIILDEPSGSEGFSYDPIFYVPTHSCSAAELPLIEKNRISHRGKALAELLEKAF